MACTRAAGRAHHSTTAGRPAGRPPRFQVIDGAAEQITRTPTGQGCPVYTGSSRETDFKGARDFKCTCTYSRPPIAMGLKGKARSVEKTRQDYGGDYAQMKDILRASV